MRDAMKRNGPFQVIHKYTGRTLARHAVVTPFLAQQGGGLAVRRDEIWYAVDYPRFRVRKGEKKYPVSVIQEKSHAY